MKKWSAALSLLVALSAPCLAAGKVLVAVTGPYSGGSAGMGASMRDGVKLAAEEINAAGGIDVGGEKLKVELVEKDDKGDNAAGAAVAQEVSQIAGLSGVIGTVNTGVAINGDHFYQEKGITKIITPAAGTGSMTPWTQGGGVKDLSIFRFSAQDGIQSQMVVEEAIKLGLKKVAILTDSTNYGISGYHDLYKQNTEHGNKLQVVATDTFNIGDRDMTKQVQKAKDAGAQAILIWGIGPELAAVANSMAKIGYHARLIGGWPLSMSSFVDNAGKNGNGALMPQSWIEEGITPRARKFIADYKKSFGEMASPMSAAEGYDAMLIFAAAVKQAGSTDSKKIRDALEDLQAPVRGVIATWRHPYGKWDPANELTHEAFRTDKVVMGEVKDGKVVFADKADKERLIAEEK